VYPQRMRINVRSAIGTSIMAGLLLIAPAAYPCSWAIGYFHQVTSLHGNVVGVKSGDFRHPFRSLRQQVAVEHAKLKLWAYRYPQRIGFQDRLVKEVEADSLGNFDFGALTPGHYTLTIASPWGEDRFDVEIVQLRKPTASVTIDVSPNYPDCTGGHEFLSVSE